MLHLIAERLASVAADTSFKVFGLTRLRIEEPHLSESGFVLRKTLPSRSRDGRVKMKKSVLLHVLPNIYFLDVIFLLKENASYAQSTANEKCFYFSGSILLCCHLY